MSDLSILCVTRAEREVMPLLRQLVVDARLLKSDLVLALDGKVSDSEIMTVISADQDTLPSPQWGNVKVVEIESQGYIESVLDEAISFTSGDYVLRIDDDEQMSRAMVEWLLSGEYQSAPHWKFSRAHLCVDSGHYITNAPLWPDHQTRLSVRSRAGGRRTIHCGSPYGGGELAPVVLEHWKFLVKSLAQREEIVARYERCQPGAGSDFAVFSTPELVIPDLNVAPLAYAYGCVVEDASIVSVAR